MRASRSFNLVLLRAYATIDQPRARDKMDVNAVLAATLSPTQQERESATSQLQSLLASNPSAYLVSLSHALAADATPSHIRNAAGLAIKNALTAREAPRQEEYAARWKGLDPATREQLKQEALATLASSDRGARNVSGQVIAAIAAVELPAGMWSGLIGQLLELAGRGDNAQLRQATLQTIGYICEGIVSPDRSSACYQLVSAQAERSLLPAETRNSRRAIERDPHGGRARSSEGGT